MTKAKIGIIGTGNIGTDLLMKVMRSGFLECSIFSGNNPDSEGLRLAERMGVRTSIHSIDDIKKDPTCCEIVFDATSASFHKIHAPILKNLGKFTIDLTPSQVGEMCVPVLNLQECIDLDNVNLVTCGGQAITPIAYCIFGVHPNIEYIEVVASIASKSAGPGTRANIDEYTQTTKEAIIKFTHVPRAKAIIIVNPASPPVYMHNTVYALVNDPDMVRLESAVSTMEGKIQEYVPGYKVTRGPVYENGRVTVMIEVVGRGDFLPKYSGNLDIITSAAITVAEEYARKNLL